MAKIIPIHGAMSGSIADNTYSHNKGGAYVRQRVVPTNRRSVTQTLVRGTIAAAARLWATLTSDQRQGWADYAATHPVIDRQGSSMTLSGESMMVGRYCQAVAVGFDGPENAPGILSPLATALSTIAVSAVNATTCTASFAVSPIAADEVIEILLGPAMGAGRDVGFAAARHAGNSAVSATSPCTITLSPAMTPGADHNLWIRTVGSDGLATPVVKQRVTCPS